jgi:homocysteine S-methyltransferase
MATSLAKRNLLSILNDGPLLFDGAMGSELANKGVLPNQCFDELSISRPELILAIHNAYIAAGANVIQTNTYGAHPIGLERHSLRSETAAINRASVALAKAAADGKALVAGSVAEAGNHIVNPDVAGSTERELLDSYAEQISVLRDAGVDLLILESFETLGVLKVALRAARDEAPDLPLIAQMRLTPVALRDAKMPVGEIAHTLSELGADIVGANCGVDPADMYPMIQEMKRAVPDVPLSAQPSIGAPHEVEGRLLYSTATDLFATYAKRFLNLGVSVVGGCCGTTPDHIRAMSGAVRFARNKQSSSTLPSGLITIAREAAAVTVERQAAPPAKVPIAERSKLGARIGHEFVISVEVNPPASLDYSRAVRASQKLIDGGATVINTTDGARASLRMDNLTFASIVQREVGCETILHVCCRDRNVLGLVSNMLAAHALGVHNLVVITGDPPKMGDFPNATAVYDLDSIGLLRILSKMNAGIDPAGREMKIPTQFVLATGAEPAAQDYPRELDRLFRKREAGADFVMTQPVYDPRTMEQFLTDTRELGIPILMGVVPLASHRNAEFLHANVPGMSIPDEIRARMAVAGNGPEARQEGIRIVVEAITAVRDQVAGAYIIPPLGQYDSAVEIIRQLNVPVTEGAVNNDGPA